MKKTNVEIRPIAIRKIIADGINTLSESTGKGIPPFSCLTQNTDIIPTDITRLYTDQCDRHVGAEFKKQVMTVMMDVRNKTGQLFF